MLQGFEDIGGALPRLVARGLNLSYHNKETILCTIDPDYGNLKSFIKNPVFSGWLLGVWGLGGSALRVPSDSSTLIIKIAEKPCIIGFLGPKALKHGFPQPRSSEHSAPKHKTRHSQPQGSTHRPLSSSFLGLPYRILNHKKELLRGLWVNRSKPPKPESSTCYQIPPSNSC